MKGSANKWFSADKLPYFTSLLVVLLTCYFAFLWKLDEMPVFIWDEGRQVVSSYEMAEHGNYLVPTYTNVPDIMNFKPPFLNWVMALSYKLFGYNVTAARIPSAFSGIILCLFIYWIFAIKHRKPWLGMLAGTLLAISPGFVGIHITRTADYDGTLTLFTFLFAYQFYLFIETGESKRMAYTAVFVALGLLTKGIAAILIAPGILLYVLLQKKLLFILKNKGFYIYGLLAFVPIISYYLYRESLASGYLQIIADNELGGRYNQVLEGHYGPWYYYIENFWKERRFYAGLMLFVPMSLVAIFSQNPFKKLALYGVLITVLFIALISKGQTKLVHYDAQAYPFMAVALAIGVYYSITWLWQKALAGKALAAGIAAFAMLMYVHGFKVLNTVLHTDYHHIMNYGRAFRQLEHENPGLRAITIYYTQYNPGYLFAMTEYGRKGFDITSKDVYDNKYDAEGLYTIGDTIMLCNDVQRDYVLSRYKTKAITEAKGCAVLVLEDSISTQVVNLEK